MLTEQNKIKSHLKHLGGGNSRFVGLSKADVVV